MKAFILLALGCLAIVSAQRAFYRTPQLVPAENAGTGGLHLQTLSELREHLGLPENFGFVSEGFRKSSSGIRRVRLRQTFNGVPIRVATLQASQDCNGFYTGSVSGFCPTISSGFDTRVSQRAQRLRKALADYVNDHDDEAPLRRVRPRELENFHYEKQIHIDSYGDPVLVYFASAIVDRGGDDGAYIRYPRALFRADDRTPIMGLLRVQKCHCETACPQASGLLGKSGQNVYGPSYPEICLNASVKKGNKCVLANDHVRVKSVRGLWGRSNAKIVSFDCDVGLDSNRGAAADAYYYSQVFYDVIQDWGRLERTHKEPHTLYVDFGETYPNSFWDGRSTTFGDGIERTYHFAVPEVIGHEMAHAITESLGNLVFNQEAAAVSEAFSDICGKAVTYYMKGSDAGWAFAYNVMRNPDKALRYFDDPTRDGSTIAHMDHYTPDLDGYTGMGLYTKAFYSIVQEQNVPFRDAFEAFVHANQIYWNEETGFLDGACGVLKAASDLGLNKHAFRSGFSCVGIDLGFCDLSGTHDHIVSSDEYPSGEIRHAQISSSRSASYKVSSATASNVRVTISCAHGVHTTMVSTCNAGGVIETHDSSYLFPLSSGTIIVVSTDSHEISDVKVHFEFE